MFRKTMSLILNLILMIRKSYDMDLGGPELNYSQCIVNIHHVYYESPKSRKNAFFSMGRVIYP